MAGYNAEALPSPWFSGASSARLPWYLQLCGEPPCPTRWTSGWEASHPPSGHSSTPWIRRLSQSRVNPIASMLLSGMGCADLALSLSAQQLATAIAELESASEDLPEEYDREALLRQAAAQILVGHRMVEALMLIVEHGRQH